MKWRFRIIALLLFLVLIALIARITYLSVFNRYFLLTQANARSLRMIDLPAYRGMILDRRGEPLAISTPAQSVWINPEDFPRDSPATIINLSRVLNLSTKYIYALLQRYADREFIYLARNLNPSRAQAVEKLAIPGVYLEQRYKRYYPQSEMTSHLVGLTNVDDEGQAGMELLYNAWLKGTPGKQRVLKDRYGKVVAVLGITHPADPGHDLKLSIDNRIQFLAYQTLEKTVQQFEAKDGSVVILNPQTGEVLAMVNQPSFNPNQKLDGKSPELRNRAMTDLFEPGSTLKAFSVASALLSKKYTPATKINTTPGFYYLEKHRIEDESNHNIITVSEVLQFSSNVGIAKIITSLPAPPFIALLKKLGFGERTDTAYPGESPGKLIDKPKIKPFELATLGFGYGISVTPLQLAQAYAILANHGLKCPITLLKREAGSRIECEQTLDPAIANQIVEMLEWVLKPGGTGVRAKVEGYHIAGKTGTAYISEGKAGYQKDKNRFVSSFVGIAPVNHPRLVVAVVIREPHHRHRAATVAAPAFAKIMAGALRILNIAPDEA